MSQVNGSDMSSTRSPDPDAIKMFVGQIPRESTEEELRQLFEPYGEIYQMIILKDRGNGQSRGCCFLTYYTRRAALEAQNALHNIKVMPGMRNPVQMKPADSETQSDVGRKLFVGMLPKSYTDNDLTVLFSPYGTLENAVILKDREGQSKGCAFVIYTAKQFALAAIKALNHTMTLEGCKAPLVVKFADTPKDKEMKMKKPNVVIPGNVPYDPNQIAAQVLSMLQSTQQPSYGPYGTAAGGMMGGNNPFQGAAGMPHGNPNTGVGGQSIPTITGGGSAGFSQNSMMNQAYSGMQQYASTYPGSYNTSQNPLLPTFTSGHAEGPDGANLFIYHLPQEYGDSELLQLFAQFGNVISAKVYMDKKTNLSKCFGFVSYDDPTAAQTAIQVMNGYQVLSKRLKVQLKKPKSEGKPY